jgi:hypothetical protein
MALTPQFSLSEKTCSQMLFTNPVTCTGLLLGFVRTGKTAARHYHHKYILSADTPLLPIGDYYRMDGSGRN